MIGAELLQLPRSTAHSDLPHNAGGTLPPTLMIMPLQGFPVLTVVPALPHRKATFANGVAPLTVKVIVPGQVPDIRHDATATRR